MKKSPTRRQAESTLRTPTAHPARTNPATIAPGGMHASQSVLVARQTSAPTRLLRLPEVIKLTGLKHDSIYRLGREGAFPRPRKLSTCASAWREDEVRTWIDSRPVSGALGQPAAWCARKTEKRS
jgi:prophage regulatory protein